MKKVTSTLLLTVIIASTTHGQKVARFFGDPIVTDTASTLFIPTRYNEEFLSANKIAFWGDYYANIVAYNFKTDSYKKIFDKDTYIEAFAGPGYNNVYGAREDAKMKNITKNWIVLLVKTTDTNNSGRVDEKDPSVLYAVSLDGQALKQVTDNTENVVSFTNFDKQGFLLIKLQRDSDNDKSFKDEDKEFYFRKVNLADLTLGKAIDLK